MAKTILLTGATDGIGLAAARMLRSQGHHLLLHGRNPEKLSDVAQSLAVAAGDGSVASFVADLSRMADVATLAAAVAGRHTSLDVLINNAGILKTSDPVTPEGLDVRFAVNTLAPYLLTRKLLPLMDASGRVVNLSSAAQATVSYDALAGRVNGLQDFDAYAQSKLAITMWSASMASSLGAGGPAIIALNPGSLLGTKMVKEGFGTAGGDIQIGADIISRAALSEEFNQASGRYFDNDSGQFGLPHPDATDPGKCDAVVAAIEAVLADLGR